MFNFKKILLFISSVILIYSACTNQPKTKKYTQAEIDSLKNEFVGYCREKNYEFIHADWSPLTEKDKSAFMGLHYFDYDISFRHEISIIQYKQQDTINASGSKPGDIRKVVRFGYLEFEQSGQKNKLVVLKILPQTQNGESHLWLGFWDLTSGDQTYPGGRYLDIKPDESGKYVIDFNYAYNPYCAYSDHYSCLIPPLENRLPIPLTCGEKIYKEHEGQK